MNKLLARMSIVGAGALPFVALAQDAPDIGYLEGLLGAIQSLFNIIVPILIAFAAIYFIWNVIWFVVAGNEEAKAQAKQRVGYGLIGLVIIIGLWGLVTILVGLLGVDTTTTPPEVPELPQADGI